MHRQITLAVLVAAAASGCSGARPEAAAGPVGASVPLQMPLSERRTPIEPMSKEKAPPPTFSDIDSSAPEQPNH